jgi:hypothetical protein
MDTKKCTAVSLPSHNDKNRVHNNMGMARPQICIETLEIVAAYLSPETKENSESQIPQIQKHRLYACRCCHLHWSASFTVPRLMCSSVDIHDHAMQRPGRSISIIGAVPATFGNYPYLHLQGIAYIKRIGLLTGFSTDVCTRAADQGCQIITQTVSIAFKANSQWPDHHTSSWNQPYSI